MLDISVVVPTYNRIETLRTVLPSLLAQDLPSERYEVLVCDSNSNDGTAEYMAAMRAQHPNLWHVAGPYSGRAMARNAGITQARGPVVLFNASDIISSPALLRHHCRHHDPRRGPAAVRLPER